MRKFIILFLVFLLQTEIYTQAFRTVPGIPVPSAYSTGGPYKDWYDSKEFEGIPEPREFGLINYFFVRSTTTNMVPTNPSAVPGVALGPIGAELGHITATSKDNYDKSGIEPYKNTFVEQRYVPIFTYTPHFFEGKVSFRASVEIDYMWGLLGNFPGENRGGAFNADMVNIQTKNAYMHWRPTSKLAIALGTQGFYDTPYDVFNTPSSTVVRTGYKLAFYGTDATGITVHSKYFGWTKASFTIASQGLEDSKKDDIIFATLDQGWEIQPGTYVGLSFWRVQDGSKGQHLLYPLVPEKGPGSALHQGFTGTRPINVDQPNGHVTFVGLNFHNNIDFHTSRWAWSGFFMQTKGHYNSQNLVPLELPNGLKIPNYKTGVSTSGTVPAVEIDGKAANFELAYKYGRTSGYETGDQVIFETYYGSGDANPRDGILNSPFTMNSYGLPGTTMVSHKSLILMPFGQAISHFTGAVTDISNRGYGLQTFSANIYYDIIPNKLNIKLGAITGNSIYRQEASPYLSNLNNEIAASTLGGLLDLVAPYDTGKHYKEFAGKKLGTEFNLEVKWFFRYLMSVGVHYGYMNLGSFYDTYLNPVNLKRERPRNLGSNPHALYITFTWIGF